MNLNEMFPSNYLSKEDFPAPRVLVMTKVTKEEVWRKNGKQKAVVLHFQNSKPMILNKTNALVIARIYGPDTGAWVGKPIEIYHDPNVMLGRDRVGGIRVRASGTAPVKQAAPVRRAPLADVENLAKWIAHEKCDVAKILAHYAIAALGDIPDAVFDECLAKVKGRFPSFMPEKTSVVKSPASAKFPSPPATIAMPLRLAGDRE